MKPVMATLCVSSVHSRLIMPPKGQGQEEGEGEGASESEGECCKARVGIGVSCASRTCTRGGIMPSGPMDKRIGEGEGRGA